VPTPFEPLPGAPRDGRVFSAERLVRLGDVEPSGRLRLDGIARYLQDVSADDTADAYPNDRMFWVVRRTRIDEHQPCGFREPLVLRTWCSGLGSRWAERRISVQGARGGRVEASSLWVCIDKETGRPAKLPEDFTTRYGVAADVPVVDAKLRLKGPPDGVGSHPWPVRHTDLDALGHVTNAAYWAVVEEEVAGAGGAVTPRTCVLEYGAGIDEGEQLEVAATASEEGVHTCWLLVGGTIRATAQVTPVPDGQEATT
jgi:acyl-ACP thioesterase